MKDDPRLVRLTKLCAELPETSCKRMGKHASFFVRKKCFVYYLDDHHGDGMLALNVKVDPGFNEVLSASDPSRFHMPAYVARYGFVGLRIDGEKVDWDEVRALVVGSYKLVAPKRLANAVVDAPPTQPASPLRETVAKPKRPATRAETNEAIAKGAAPRARPRRSG